MPLQTIKTPGGETLVVLKLDVGIPVRALSAVESGIDTGDPVMLARISEYLERATPSLAARTGGQIEGAEAAV